VTNSARIPGFPPPATWEVDVNLICDQGCTYTQGYWKTHSEFGPAPFDETWAMLPNGASTLFYNSGKTWYVVFHTPIPSPAGPKRYYQLAHQFMAAKLNHLAGANSSAVSGILDWCETKFAAWPSASVPGEDREDAFAYATTLDQYNNGIIGPGHCDDELPYYRAEQSANELNVAKSVQVTAYPNPFAGEVQLTISMPYDSPVTLDVLNAKGQKVTTVFSGYMSAGQTRTVTFNASAQSQGLFVYRLTTDREVRTGQMISMK
jgi:hypothetical protein